MMLTYVLVLSCVMSPAPAMVLCSVMMSACGMVLANVNVLACAIALFDMPNSNRFNILSISIFFKSVDISTIDIRYRYIEQGYTNYIHRVTHGTMYAGLNPNYTLVRKRSTTIYMQYM